MMVKSNRQPIIMEIAPREVRLLYRENSYWKTTLVFSYENEDLINQLKRHRQKALGKCRVPVYLLIPFENGLIRELRLPWINQKERDYALKYYIQQEIPILLEDFVYDYQITEDVRKEYLHIRLTAVQKDRITAYAQVVEQAGFRLKGVGYSISAMGEGLALDPGKTAVFLQKIEDNRIQMIVYQRKYPKMIREIEMPTADIEKSHIYLALNGYAVPHAYVFTDETIQAEMIAHFLVESGLVIEHKKSNTIVKNDTDNPENMQYWEVALYGERQRVKHKNNNNLYASFLRPQKMKWVIGCMVGILVMLIVYGGAIWYPDYTHETQLQREVSVLQQRISNLDDGIEKTTWDTWEKEWIASQANLEKIRKTSLSLEEGIIFTRINYKSDTLYLWLECQENSKITTLLGKLTAEGWKDPSLLDYKYTPDKITVYLSVKR